MRHTTVGLVALVVLALSAAAVQGAISIDMVPIGNLGNTADTRFETPGHGAVDYAYNIGKYEITADQYTEFLNAVDPTGDNVLGLYHLGMDLSTFGCQITWNSNTSLYDFSGIPS